MPDTPTPTPPKVQIGLSLDLRNPPAWQRPWPQLYRETIDRVVMADSLGVDAAWTSEHHLWADGHLTQPLTFAAAIAARTSRMRVGTAIMNGAIRKPIDLAEQAAVVDIISDGRLELGLGSGYDSAEHAAYGVDYDRRHRLLRDNIRELKRIWQGGITPQPVQEELPLWVGAAGPRMLEFTGSIGAGLVHADDPAVRGYMNALDDPSRARIVGMPNLFVADDPEEAWRIIEPYQRWIAGAYSAAGADQSGLAANFSDLRHREGIPPVSTMDVVTPEEAIRRLEPWIRSRPLTHVLFLADIAGLPGWLLDRQIELVAEHIVGAFDRTPVPVPPTGD